MLIHLVSRAEHIIDVVPHLLLIMIIFQHLKGLSFSCLKHMINVLSPTLILFWKNLKILFDLSYRFHTRVVNEFSYSLPIKIPLENFIIPICNNVNIIVRNTWLLAFYNFNFTSGYLSYVPAFWALWEKIFNVVFHKRLFCSLDLIERDMSVKCLLLNLLNFP